MFQNETKDTSPLCFRGVYRKNHAKVIHDRREGSVVNMRIIMNMIITIIIIIKIIIINRIMNTN